MTPFRASQVGAVLRSVVVGLAPNVVSLPALRDEVKALAADGALWAQLELDRDPLPEPRRRATTPTSPLMEPNRD